MNWIDIINRNEKGQWHGYAEIYSVYGLTFRGTYHNSNMSEYVEWHVTYRTLYFIR